MAWNVPLMSDAFESREVPISCSAEPSVQNDSRKHRRMKTNALRSKNGHNNRTSNNRTSNRVAAVRPSSQTKGPLSSEHLRKMDAYWRAANYLSVGQIYLYDNPLLKEPLTKHVKPRLLGHWGTTPGLNFIYVHLNRVIKQTRPEHDLHHRPRPRRPGHRGQYLARRHLQRTLSRTSRRTKRG